jgi:hypothetical protein
MKSKHSMKAAIFAIAALAIGIATGIGLTQQEFSHEAVPVDVTPVRTGGPTGPKYGPKVVIVNGERYEFGSMDRNGHGTHSYIVRNDGDAPLTLSTGQPSCSVCIKVFQVAKEILQPGEKTEVKIEWDVKTSGEEFEQSGPLNTNDRIRPSVHLSIHGRVLDTVRADRSDIHFHDLSPNETASGSINIFAFREPDLRIEKHEFENPDHEKFFNISFTPVSSDDLAREKAKSGLKMNVEVKPGLPYGDFREEVNVSTNQSPDPVKVHLIGNVASDILLVGQNVVREKSIVNFGAVSQKDGKKQTIFLIVKGSHRDETKVELASYEPTTDFKATLGEVIHDSAKSARYPIVIEVPPGAALVTRTEGSYAKINLTTTHPEIKEINIKVRYVVKE